MISNIILSANSSSSQQLSTYFLNLESLHSTNKLDLEESNMLFDSSTGDSVDYAKYFSAPALQLMTLHPSLLVGIIEKMREERHEQREEQLEIENRVRSMSTQLADAMTLTTALMEQKNDKEKYIRMLEGRVTALSTKAPYTVPPRSLPTTLQFGVANVSQSFEIKDNDTEVAVFSTPRQAASSVAALGDNYVYSERNSSLFVWLTDEEFKFHSANGIILEPLELFSLEPQCLERETREYDFKSSIKLISEQLKQLPGLMEDFTATSSNIAKLSDYALSLLGTLSMGLDGAFRSCFSDIVQLIHDSAPNPQQELRVANERCMLLMLSICMLVMMGFPYLDTATVESIVPAVSGLSGKISTRLGIS